jgi:hypothetical protein
MLLVEAAGLGCCCSGRVCGRRADRVASRCRRAPDFDTASVAERAASVEGEMLFLWSGRQEDRL